VHSTQPWDYFPKENLLFSVASISKSIFAGLVFVVGANNARLNKITAIPDFSKSQIAKIFFHWEKIY